MRITTEQAPIAKQISVGKRLSTSWETIIDVPDYDIPASSYSNERTISRCAAEIISPIIVSNVGSTDNEYSIQIIKGLRYLDTSQDQDDYSGVTSEVDGIIYGGTFNGGTNYSVGETITLSNGAELTVDLVDDDKIVTEFSFASAGSPLERPGSGYVILTGYSDESVGTGFILYVAEDNFLDTESTFMLANAHTISVSNTATFPLNGQILTTGDRLQVKANTASNVHIFVSYTEGQAEEDRPI
jgi:hypothetical protein